MGALLTELVNRKPGKQVDIPHDIAIEAKIARRVLSDLPSVHDLGHQVPFNCPDCGGVLWEVENVEALRFRCHTGHAFTAEVLLGAQTEKIEETLWYALRMFEEHKNMLNRLDTVNGGGASTSLTERREESDLHIERIRSMLKASDET